MPPTQTNITNSFLQRFFTSMQQFTAPNRQHNTQHYVPKDLTTATHVWVRNHTPHSTFSPRYKGPFKVISRQPKTLIIDNHGKHDTISIDHCKPAHLQTSTDTDTPARSQQHAPHFIDAHADSKPHSDRQIHAETMQHMTAQQSTHSHKQTHHTQATPTHTARNIPQRTILETSSRNLC